MTENEAIDKLNNLHYKILHSSFSSMVYESEIEALCKAKDCLKEIQQYKEKEQKRLNTWLNDISINIIDDFANTLIPRLTDAIYQKDVESMTNLINDVARELKEGGKNE